MSSLGVCAERIVTSREPIDRSNESARSGLDPELARRILGATEQVLVIADAAETGFPIVWASPSFEALTGYQPSEVLGRGCGFLQGPESDPLAIAQMAEALADARPARTIIRNYRKDGTPFWNEVSLTPVRDEDGALTHVTAILNDVSAAIAPGGPGGRSVPQRALADLPGRAGVENRLQGALVELAETGGAVGVLGVCVTGLEALTEPVGHEDQDELLGLITVRLLRALTDLEIVGRLGANELVVISRSSAPTQGFTQLAERILAVFDDAFALGKEEVQCFAAVGIASAVTPQADPGGLIRDSETAVRRARTRGGSTIEVFDQRLRARVDQRARLAKDLREALAGDSIGLAFQPVVDIGNGAVRGLEALARWNHPQDGPISPGVFVPIAEETGMIVELGTALARKACVEFAAAGLPDDLRLSINVSARQLSDRHLVGSIEGAAGAAGLELERIAIEITETALTTNPDDACARLWELRELGVAVHLDDFGAGFASLGHLRRFPIDTLKIDRSFIGGLGMQSQDASIVRAIMPMGRALGLDVIAEGVETEPQLAHLSSLGCRLAQGFFFSRAAPIETMSALIEADKLAARTAPDDSRLAELRTQYREAISSGDVQASLDAVRAALTSGVAPTVVQTQLIGPALRSICEEAERGTISAADEHLATSISEQALGEILVLASRRCSEARGKVLMAAVQGEHHVMGLRMTTDLLQGAGFEPVYLGASVPSTELIDAVRNHQPAAVCLTATMPESTWGLADLIENLRRIAPRTAIVVGGLERSVKGLEGSGALIADTPQAAVKLIEGLGPATGIGT
ncbi:MAG: hypothetical protein QOJ01_1257 [Solirubrobacterales bacterium]|nr:hypothetical protein [Solirubrobacterales bacterium]